MYSFTNKLLYKDCVHVTQVFILHITDFELMTATKYSSLSNSIRVLSHHSGEGRKHATITCVASYSVVKRPFKCVIGGLIAFQSYPIPLTVGSAGPTMGRIALIGWSDQHSISGQTGYDLRDRVKV